MSVKANRDKDSILADTKELLKILLPAIQTMPKIERIDGAAVEMKRAAFDMIHHFTIGYNCPEVRAYNIQQMFGDYGKLIACFEILMTQRMNTQPTNDGMGLFTNTTKLAIARKLERIEAGIVKWKKSLRSMRQEHQQVNTNNI